MEKKVEQGVMENGKHIPNRIFRGRIVEFVRKNEMKEVGIEELGKEIKKDYTTNEEEWLLMLCARLKEEGFLEYSKKKNKIKQQSFNSIILSCNSHFLQWFNGFNINLGIFHSQGALLKQLWQSRRFCLE